MPPKSSLDIAYILGLSNTDPNYIKVTADMSSATWNTVASHEVLTITGLVRLQFIIQCTETLTDAASGASIQCGLATDTTAFIASTGAAGAGASTISTGELWFDATPTETWKATDTARLDFLIANSDHFGYEITGAALLDGTLVFHMWPELIGDGSAAIAGAGGSL